MEKESPPPYQMYPNQNQGYPQSNPGYPQPNAGYPQQNNGYPQQNNGYPQQNNGYPVQPQPNYGSYPQPQPVYPQPRMNYPNQGYPGYPQPGYTPAGLPRHGYNPRGGYPHTGMPGQQPAFYPRDGSMINDWFNSANNFANRVGDGFDRNVFGGNTGGVVYGPPGATHQPSPYPQQGAQYHQQRDPLVQYPYQPQGAPYRQAPQAGPYPSSGGGSYVGASAPPGFPDAGPPDFHPPPKT